MKYLLSFLPVLISLLALQVRGAEAHNDLPGLPTSLLLIEGEKCMEADSLEERAAAAFNVVVNRYYQNPNDTAIRHAAVIALRHLGNIHLTHRIDYRKAYRYLHLARQMASDDGNDYQLAFILNSLAALYTTNAGDNDSINAMSHQLLLDALRTSLRSNNYSLLPTVGINIAFLSFSNGNWGIFKDDIHKIETLQFDSVNSTSGYTVKTIVKATDAFFGKNYELAENLIQDARRSMPKEYFAERFDYTFDMFLIDLYLHTAQTSKATDTMREVLQKATDNGNTDYEIKILYQLAVTYDELGIMDSVEKYYPRYLKLRAEMRAKTGYGEIEKLDFLAEIERTNKELENLSIRHQKAQRNFMITVSALIIVAITLLALLFVYINLKRTHRNLFVRNQEALKRETQHKLMREEWDKDRAMLEQEITKLNAELKPTATTPTTTMKAAAATDEEPDEADRELQMRLYTRILRIMEENPVIFQPGFAMADLAGLLNVTPRAVSRAINICHNSNFHQLLNEYRIREVTRLMHDPKTEGLTIEAIAECAGFRSRTAFSRLFKKIIGLTPSEYIKMAQKRSE